MHLPPDVAAKLAAIDHELARLPDNEADRRDALRTEAAALLDALDGEQADREPDSEPNAEADPVAPTGRVLVQLSDINRWQAELDAANTAVLEAEGALIDVAAPAALGDPEAHAQRAELIAERDEALARITDLKTLLASGAKHLSTQEAERERLAREAAFVEAEGQRGAQVTAGEAVDAALVAAEAAWNRYQTVAADRQGALRRAGRPVPRHVLGMALEAAMLRLAPRLALVLRVNRLPAAVRRPLADLVR